MVNRNLLRQCDLSEADMSRELDAAFGTEDWLPADAQDFNDNKLVTGREAMSAMDRLCSGTATLGDFCSMAGAGGTGTGAIDVDPAAGGGANGCTLGVSLDESLLQPERTKVTKKIEAACFFTASLLVGHHSHFTAPDCHVHAGNPG